MAEETVIEYNARCKDWGEGPTGYRATRPGGAYWPQPPAMPANGGAWADFVDTDCGTGDSYRYWFDHFTPQPSGGTGQRTPPPPPPKRQ